MVLLFGKISRFVIALVISVACAGALADQHLKARGWTHETFGRLVLDGAAALVQTIDVDGNRLIVGFSEPVSVDFGNSLRNLETYVDPDPLVEPGRIVMILKQPVTMKAFANLGNQVIDLTPAPLAEPASQATSMPPAPAEAVSSTMPDQPGEEPVPASNTLASNSDPNGPAEVMVTREESGAGVHLAFRWPTHVEYRVNRSERFAIIDFRSPGHIDAARLTAAFPEGEVRVERPPSGGVRVILRLPPGLEVRDLREGNAVVLEFTKSNAVIDLEHVRFAQAQQSDDDFVCDGSRTYQTLMAMPESADTPTAVSEQSQGSGNEPVGIGIRSRGTVGGVELRFDFQADMRAAAFRMGNTVWLVFDHPPVVTPTLPKDPALTALGTAEFVPLDDAIAIRLTSNFDLGIELNGEGKVWTAWIRRNSASKPIQPIVTHKQKLDDGSTSLVLDATSPSAPIDIEDASGHLSVIALPVQGQGVKAPIEGAGYLVLASQQGIVVSAKSERLQIASMPKGVVLTVQGPSSNAATAQTSTTTPGLSSINPLSVSAGVFDLNRWRRADQGTYTEERRNLETLVQSASDDQRAVKRLDLAEFLFAHGLADETLTTLNIIAMTDPAQAGGTIPTLLRAAASYFKRDYGKADELLSDQTLDLVPEATLFKAALAAERQDWKKAAELFSRPLPNLADYPPIYRVQLGLAAVTALAEGGNPLGAQFFLDQLSHDVVIGDAADRIEFASGLVQLSVGKPDEAMKIWAGLQDSQVGEVRARATLAVTEDRLQKGEIDAAQAISALDAIRFAWRGNDFEFQLLRRLGSLYLEAGDARHGLLTLRQAATNFPTRPEAKEVAADMQTAFKKLYLGGGADQMTPMSAVGLYQEFRELTPTGGDGDRMVTALADRLVKADLLDQAASILTDQVNKRLQGVEKARVGARLAAIRMLDRKPDLALSALSESSVADPLPEPLMNERRRLEARARFDVGDTLAGLALLSDDASVEALWLRADMYWRLREWNLAAETLDELIRQELATSAAMTAAENAKRSVARDPMQAVSEGNSKPNMDEPGRQYFKDRIAPLLLNRAVALSLAGNRRGLKALAKEFGEVMSETNQAQGFAMLTAPDNGLVESVSAELKSVDQIQTFVDEYRKRLEKASLSGS